MTQVAIIGGGISGLASAYFLSQKINPTEITVIESTDRLGGTIKPVRLGSHEIESGPDSFITRNTAALDLVEDLSLADRLISPATGSAFIYSRSRLHPIPGGTVFGAPSDFGKFLGNTLISRRGQIRAALEPLLAREKIAGDTTVGTFARKRWGKEVAERLIDPLVGGIHAGTVDQLSLAQCAPQYLKAAQSHRSVSRGLKEQVANYTPANRPAFLSLQSGLSELVDALVARLGSLKVNMLTDAKVGEIQRSKTGYVIHTDGGVTDAEGVICTTPTYIASRILRSISKTASDLLDTIEYASPIMTLLSYEDDAFAQPLTGSGVLVPRTNRLLTSAITFATNKWPDLKDEGRAILRVSAGRIGDNRIWKFSDEALIPALEAEMTEILGARARSNASEISRWHRRIPQFKPFHNDLIRRIRDELPTGMELAGAPFLGVGIPACVSSASMATNRIVNMLSRPH